LFAGVVLTTPIVAHAQSTTDYPKPADPAGCRLRAWRRHRYARPPFNGRTRPGTRADDLYPKHRRRERLYRVAERRRLRDGRLHIADGGERSRDPGGVQGDDADFRSSHGTQCGRVSAHSPLALCVADAIPVNSVRELIAYSHSSGKTLNYASAGTGSVA